jgi:hypothetical protein
MLLNISLLQFVLAQEYSYSRVSGTSVDPTNSGQASSGGYELNDFVEVVWRFYGRVTELPLFFLVVVDG